MGTLTVNATNGQTVAKGASYLVPRPSGKSLGNYQTSGATITTSDGSVYPVTVSFGALGITVTNPTGRDIESGKFDFIDLQTSGILARFNASGETEVLMGPRNTEVSMVKATVDPVSGISTMKVGNVTSQSSHQVLPDSTLWKGNDEGIIASVTTALKQTRNLTPHVSRADAFSSVSTGAGATQFAGALMVPNGDVVFPPFSCANVKHYKHSTATVTTGAAHGEGAAAFATGTYSNSADRVIFVSHSSNYFGIWNHNNLSYTRGAAHGEASPAFAGSCEIADGRIICAPYASLYVGIYDPVTNTYRRGPAHGQAANAFECAIPLPNGDVLFTPISATGNLGIYTPDYTGGGVGTFATVAHSEGVFAFQGGVLLPNGKVVLVPFNSTRAGIFTSTGQGTGTYTAGPLVSSVTTGTTLQFCGGVLLADGRAMFIPRGCTNFVYYDWKTNTLQLGPAHGSPIDSSMYVGGCLLPDGVVVAAPFSSTNIGIVNTWMSPVRDKEMCMHSCWNHY